MADIIPIKKPKPLPSVAIEDAVAIKALRLQLFDNGYVPMEAHDKKARRKAWNITEVDHAEIASWLHARQGSTRWPATVLRVEKGLLALDLDIPDKALAEETRAIVMSIAPQVFTDGALERGRDDGSPKTMFVMRRAGEPFMVKSHQWLLDPTDVKGPVFGVEVFATERTARGGVQRYIGAFGPHTVDERGRVLISYAWKGPSPKEVSIDALPEMSEAQALAICDAFDKLAESRGLVLKPGRRGRVDPIDVYDLDENMRFDGDEFQQATLAQLVETYWLNQSLNLDTRCSSTFLGEGGSRQDRCHVGWSGPRETGHITVHDYRNEVTHRPAGIAPPTDEEMRAGYAEIMALHDGDKTQEARDRQNELWTAAVRISEGGHNSDKAVARGVMLMLDDQFRFDGYDWRKFDGTVWAEAKKHEIEFEASEFAASIPMRSADAAGIREHKRLASMKTAQAVDRMLRPMVYADPKLFDADPYIIAAGDEVVEIKTGLSRPGKPEDMLSKRCPVAPSDHEDCPLWLRFLYQAMQGDMERVRFLQQWAGMGLCGVPLHQKLAYFHGAGGNGKNVFIDTIAAVAGDYAHTSDISLLMATRGDKHPTDMWALRGRRTVMMSEPDENATWDTAKVKALTGDGRITARGMRKDFETFPRQWTITVVGNNKPRLKHVDDAMRRRIMLVPFEYSVPKEERDEELVAKLVAEAPGILRWMINGYLDVRANGLIEPKAIVEATMDYLHNEDIVGSFVEEEIVEKPGGKATLKDVFERWQAYAAAAGAEAGFRTPFGERMDRVVQKTIGDIEYRRRRAGMLWLGIELRSIDWSRLEGVDEV